MYLRFFLTWLGLTAGGFAYQFFGAQNYLAVAEHSYWMAIALALGAWQTRVLRTEQ